MGGKYKNSIAAAACLIFHTNGSRIFAVFALELSTNVSDNECLLKAVIFEKFACWSLLRYVYERFSDYFA